MNPLDRRTQRRNRLLAGYLTDSLSAGERRDLLRELETDEAFAREAASLRRCDRALETIFHMETDAGFVEKTVASSLYAHDRESFSRRVLDKTRMIERRRAEWAARNRRRRTWAGFGWAAAAALLLALGATLYLNRTTGPYRAPVLARVGSDSPGVLVTRNGRPVPFVSGMPLRDGDRIEAPFGREAVLTLVEDGTRVAVREATALTLLSDSNSLRLTLDAGAVWVEAAARAPTRPLLFVAPQAVARVVGTAFSLSAEGAATRLDVFEGQVELTDTASGKTIPVPQGHYARAGGDRPFAARPIPTGDNIRYGPGRVLFQDDFSSLTHWDIVQAPREPEHAKFVPAEEEQRKQLEIGQAPRNGSTEPCLVFRVDKNSPFKMGLRLKKNIRAEAYVVEWLFRLEEPARPGEGLTLVQPGVTDFRTFLEGGKDRVPVGHWFRRKIELFPTPASNENEIWRQLNVFTCDPHPTLTESYAVRINPAEYGSVLAQLGRVRLLIGRCVIRELVPESGD